MTHRFLSHHQRLPQTSVSNQTAPRWWWPLTRWWAICGVIIFIGLFMSLIDNVAHWQTDQPTASIERQGVEAFGQRPDQRNEASTDRSPP